MASFLLFLQKNFEFLQLNLEMGLGADSEKFILIRNKVTNDIRSQMHAVRKLDVGDASSALELIRKACLPEEVRSALVERMA